MSTPQTQGWIACPRPAIGDILKWSEPIWAAPNKPRGKRDQIGEQEIVATLRATGEILELEVMSVHKTSSGDAPLSVKSGDHIRRKQSSLEKGACCKQIG